MDECAKAAREIEEPLLLPLVRRVAGFGHECAVHVYGSEYRDELPLADASMSPRIAIFVSCLKIDLQCLLPTHSQMSPRRNSGGQNFAEVRRQ